MKYKRGEFTTVPNTRSLHLLSATAQSLFIWICIYSDDEGICFPSRATLANNLNCSVSTIDRYLKELVEKCFIQKTNRYYDNEKISNEYQLLIIEGGSVKSTLGSVKNDPRGSVKSTHRTKSIITKSIISDVNSQKVRVVFDRDEDTKPKKTKSTCYAVFDVFKGVIGKAPLNWQRNKTERVCAENLYKERGLDQIRRALEFYVDFKDNKFCPVVESPYALDSKWAKLNNFKKKQDA